MEYGEDSARTILLLLIIISLAKAKKNTQVDLLCKSTPTSSVSHRSE